MVHFLDIQIAKKRRVAKPNGIETKIEHLEYRIVSRPILRILKNSQNQDDLRILRVPSVRRNA